ncbi:hypothetical protein [Streptomyces noursei]|uniref:hypothetical protein n=1 Tax=Streptomyces noursei TaxID=1971 RepID=UPI001672EF79|nr:hypothetical protein [Streptomyces noursei]MCZ1019873.1 hypothetical protein [Streptomyces noursei]GGX33964.1 hypothetical protein GCM10010341_64320 [Streptomyces noursei]
MDTAPHRPGNRDAWLQGDRGWNDLTGPSRARRIAQQQAKYQALTSAWPATDQWWVSEAVDREAVEVGYLMLDTVAPTGPADRDRTALAALEALTAINDSYAACARYEDIFSKFLFGRTVGDWVEAASCGATAFERHAIEEALRVQYDTLAEQRVERGTAQAAEQVAKNRADYREYLRWRDAEGCFYGVLLLCAVAAGIDLQHIPRVRVTEALEAGIVAFDVHSMPRHRAEDETADIFRYLPGTHREKTDAALGLLRDLHTDLIHADDLAGRDKEFLLRYVTAGSLLPYLAQRWSRTTALHVPPAGATDGHWTHVSAEFRHAVGYSDVG